MSTTWVMVANGSRARLFESRHREEPLHQLGSFANPGEMPIERQAVEPYIAWREEHAARFARALLAALGHGLARHRFERLIFVAPTQFLDMMRLYCDRSLRNCVVGEIQHDFTMLGSTEVHERVAPWLEPSVPHAVSVRPDSGRAET